MTRQPTEEILRAVFVEHEDPRVAERAAGLTAGARRLAGRRRAVRMVVTAGAMVAVVGVSGGLVLTVRPDPTTPNHPALDQSNATQAVDPGRLDRAFRAAWPGGAELVKVSIDTSRPEQVTGRYRYPASASYPAEPGFTLAQPGRPPTHRELDPCGQPQQGALAAALCQLTNRPDGSRVLVYELSGMDGRHWTYATVATHFRAGGETVTVRNGVRSDDGQRVIPDLAVGPDELVEIATNPSLTF
jgi:hypothetical protein